MTKIYICSVCGQDINRYKDQCPYCKASGDNLIESNYNIQYNDEDFFNYESDYDTE